MAMLSQKSCWTVLYNSFPLAQTCFQTQARWLCPSCLQPMLSKLSLLTLTYSKVDQHRGNIPMDMRTVCMLTLIFLVCLRYANQVLLVQAQPCSCWAIWNQHVCSPRSQHQEMLSLSWLCTSLPTSLLLSVPEAQDQCLWSHLSWLLSHTQQHMSRETLPKNMHLAARFRNSSWLYVNPP